MSDLGVQILEKENPVAPSVRAPLGTDPPFHGPSVPEPVPVPVPVPRACAHARVFARRSRMEENKPAHLLLLYDDCLVSQHP